MRSEPFACINPAPFFDRVRVVDAAETIELRHAVVIADGASDADRMAALADAAAAATEIAARFAQRAASRDAVADVIELIPVALEEVR